VTFSELIPQYEVIIRLSFFFGIFASVSLWEIIKPRRILKLTRLIRWPTNLGLSFLNSFVSRVLFPSAAVGVAFFATENNVGVLNYYRVPPLTAVILSIIAMDFVIYLQHVMLHAVPALWRLHRVHHADLEYDVTTGARFHPIEIILSMLIKFATILILGVPMIAVVIFEVVLSSMAMFNHGNIRLPLRLDNWLRYFVVTPDMHRIHHSVEDNEANSNFGFNLSLWDRVLGTYRSEPRGGHAGMTIGIHEFSDPKWTTGLPSVLLLPFVGKNRGYSINRREWNEPDE
jgi:sterol desaturase/sphingolipid hydroxylase (fatty acid hydroxylase superfamily)